MLAKFNDTAAFIQRFRFSRGFVLACKLTYATDHRVILIAISRHTRKRERCLYDTGDYPQIKSKPHFAFAVLTQQPKSSNIDHSQDSDGVRSKTDSTNHDDNVDPAVRENDTASGEENEERPKVLRSSSNDIQREQPLGRKSVLLLRLNDKLRQKLMENGESVTNSFRRHTELLEDKTP